MRADKRTVSERLVELYYTLYKNREIQSKSQFCRLIGVHPSQFAKIETGERSTTIDAICAAIEIFGVSGNYFFGDGKC